MRPALSVRTVSVGGRVRPNKFAGEMLLDFQVNPQLDPNRFMQGPSSASQESDSTVGNSTEPGDEGQEDMI